jgi:hypothetical protein
MLSVVMLNVDILSVVASQQQQKRKTIRILVENEEAAKKVELACPR